MCGIAIVNYGPDGPDAEEWTPNEFAQIMLPAMVHRGPHAFGVMYYDGEQIWQQKCVGRSDNAKLVRQIRIPRDIQWLVLHVRYATKGKPEDNINNHPVLHDDTMGVHNGVVRNYHSVLNETGRHRQEWYDDRFAEVDSEAIFAAVNRHDNGYVEPLRNVDFQGVAVWTHFSDQPWKLHIARSENRPFVFTTTPTGAKLFASEEVIIEATGVEHDEYIGMGKWRLYEVHEGRITSNVKWRKPLLSTPTNPVRSPGPFSGITDSFYEDGTPTRSKKGKKPRTPRGEKAAAARSGPVSSRQLQDGDRVGNQFWYGGKLYNEQDFLEIVSLEAALRKDALEDPDERED